MRRSAATSSRSSLVHVRLKVAPRRSRSPKQSDAVAHVSSAAARTSRALHLMLFRDSAKKVYEYSRKSAKTYGLKIVTEALDEAGVDLVERYGDIIQIGARNMQNFTLLRRAGKAKLPVLLKRGLSATLDEWLLAAEYIMAEGNYQVVLCERGI